MQNIDLSFGQSLDTSLDTSLDVDHSLDLYIEDRLISNCLEFHSRISEFSVPIEEAEKLNHLHINGLPIHYTPYNLQCSLVGMALFSGEFDFIHFVLSSPELSLYCWRRLEESEDCLFISDLIKDFQVSNSSKE